MRSERREGTNVWRSMLARLSGRASGGDTGPAPAAPAAEDSAVGSPPSGDRPVVPAEKSHYGEKFDALVERARHNQRRYQVNADYDLVRESFDHYHYLLQDQALYERPAADPIRVFLRGGADARHSPHPDFSMKKYLQRYPHHRDGGERSPYLEWLKRGRKAGELADPADGVEVLAPLLGLAEADVVARLVDLRADTLERLRSGTLGEMFAKAVDMEPLIGEAWSHTADIKQLPFRNEAVARGAAAIHAAHEDAGFRRARVVLVTSSPASSAEHWAPGEVATVLAEHIDAGEIVVVYTDEPGRSDPDVLPSDVREVDLASRLQGVGPGVREEVLVSLLRSFAAETIVNVDSDLCYRILAPYGRALASSERLLLYFLPHTEGLMGNRDGHGLRWLYQAFDLVAGVITHDDDLRRDLVEHFQLGESDQQRLRTFQRSAEFADWLVGPCVREAGA